MPEKRVQALRLARSARRTPDEVCISDLLPFVNAGDRAARTNAETGVRELAKHGPETLEPADGAIPSVTHHTRRALTAIVEDMGGHVTTSVSGNTDVLVVGDEPGTRKREDAEENDVPKLSQAEFWMLVEQSSGDSEPATHGFSRGRVGSSQPRSANVSIGLPSPEIRGWWRRQRTYRSRSSLRLLGGRQLPIPVTETAANGQVQPAYTCDIFSMSISKLSVPSVTSRLTGTCSPTNCSTSSGPSP